MTNYVEWKSELSLEQVYQQGETFQYPEVYNNGVLYLSTLNDEAGRLAVKYISGDHDSECDRSKAIVTPQRFNIRSKINEYGGKAYWVYGNSIYFVNKSDQRIYQQKLIGTDHQQWVHCEPIAITPESNERTQHFAEFTPLSNDHSSFVMIAESEMADHSSENIHQICGLSLSKEGNQLVALVQGADFYNNLVVDQTNKRLAWVQWNHPNMPWDSNQLWVAEYEQGATGLSVHNRMQIELDPSASFNQLHFAHNGRLFFSVDFAGRDNESVDNFWNIRCFDFKDGKVRHVTKEHKEFGYPHWQYGDRRITQFDNNHLLTVGSTPNYDDLYLIEQNSLKVSKLEIKGLKNSTIQSLSSNCRGLAGFVFLPHDNHQSIVTVNIQLEMTRWLFNTNSIDQSDVSVAQHFSYQTKDESEAFAYYYPPKNRLYESDSIPPLIVMVHGGPTSRAYAHFDIAKQFWTNRGFALLDVNHRGSSGYGRVYRDALYGEWGEIDCADIIDAIRFLIKENKADANSVCIRGKSAGGYAVLRALTEFPKMFKSGACYYGIGNLATLAQTTHKFEKFYTDRLIGEKYDSDAANKQSSLFFQRSPSHNMHKVRSEMILFQGLQDKVVPPSVAQEVIKKLTKAGIEYSYVEYPNEGHGFRQVTNNMDALAKELAFYQRALST